MEFKSKTQNRIGEGLWFRRS